MTDLPHWTLPQLEQYVEIALETMAKEGVVSLDTSGQRAWDERRAWQAADGSLHIEFAADLSVIGLPAVVPMAAVTQPDGRVRWSLGGQLIAMISGDWMPEEAGEAIGREQLRAAYRQWADRNKGGELSR